MNIDKKPVPLQLHCNLYIVRYEEYQNRWVCHIVMGVSLLSIPKYHNIVSYPPQASMDCEQTFLVKVQSSYYVRSVVQLVIIVSTSVFLMYSFSGSPDSRRGYNMTSHSVPLHSIQHHHHQHQWCWRTSSLHNNGIMPNEREIGTVSTSVLMDSTTL